VPALTYTSATITDTAGFIAVDNTNKAVVLSFRGSYSVRNWIADASFAYTIPGLCDGCLAELGFWSSWRLVRDKILPQLKDAVSQNPDYEVVVVGHSLGAAIASLAAADLRVKGYPSAKLYAYAAPRVANPALAKFITAQGNNYRFTHTNDPVPKLPLLSMGYVHISPEYYITAPNNATVTASDVKVIEGAVSFEGNTGTGIPTIASFDAHHWYFEEADAGVGEGLPFKRAYV
jgi:pimeloyl-ACP methyl ester carboxylesterase